MIKISPSIMCADFRRLGEQVQELEAAGADMLHLDVMDGHFAANFALSFDLIASIRDVTTLPFDVHLVISEPERYIATAAQAGADYISFHPEACPHVHRVVGLIKEQGCKAGLALCPATPLSFLDTILPELDMVTLMSVDVGFAGQRFVRPVLKKIRALRDRVNALGLATEIEVDGQVNAHTITSVVQAGASVLVVGTSGLFAVPEGIAQGMIAIRRQVQEALEGEVR